MYTPCALFSPNLPFRSFSLNLPLRNKYPISYHMRRHYRVRWQSMVCESDNEFQRYGRYGRLNFLQRVSIACYAKRCISYRKSVRLSVRHTVALCQNDSSYDHGVFTVG